MNIKEHHSLISKCKDSLKNEGWSVFVQKSKTGLRQRLLRYYQINNFLHLRRNQLNDFLQWRLYMTWVSKNEPGKRRLSAMKKESMSWAYRPKISIITPVYNIDRYALLKCINSVLKQAYDNWEFCLVDGGSDKAYYLDFLITKHYTMTHETN